MLWEARDGVGKEGITCEACFEGEGEREDSSFTKVFCGDGLVVETFLLAAAWRVVRGIASYFLCFKSLDLVCMASD